MKIKPEDDTVRIVFGSIETRAAMLLLLEMTATGVAGFWILYEAVLASIAQEFVVSLFFVVMGSCLAFVTVRLAKRITGREQLILSTEGITLIGSASSRNTARFFAYKQIEDLRFAGNTPATPHPLGAGPFDAMGFRGRQNIVDTVNAEGNIAFYYGGQSIRFGTGVPSWEAAKIAGHILSMSDHLVLMAGLPDDIPDAFWKRGSGGTP